MLPTTGVCKPEMADAGKLSQAESACPRAADPRLPLCVCFAAAVCLPIGLLHPRHTTRRWRRCRRLSWVCCLSRYCSFMLVSSSSMGRSNSVMWIVSICQNSVLAQWQPFDSASIVWLGGPAQALPATAFALLSDTVQTILVLF